LTVDHELVTGAIKVSFAGSILYRGGGESGGQNVNSLIEEYPDDPRVARIAELWERWHLNDLVPGCSHQPEVWTCTNLRSQHDEGIGVLRDRMAVLRELPAAEENVANIEQTTRDLKKALMLWGKAHEAPVENGWSIIRAEFGKYPYPERGDECYVCGRNRWEEPSDYCPETGYRFGTRWLIRLVPEEVICELKELMPV